MTIKLNVGRQEVITARVAFTLGTGLDVSAQAVYPAIQVPQGAIILGGHLYVSDDTSASVKIAVGDATLGTRYASNIAADSVALTALVPTGFQYPTQDNVTITVSGATAAATGAAELIIRYLKVNRAEFSQG
jgi:hypothetical protein